MKLLASLAVATVAFSPIAEARMPQPVRKIVFRIDHKSDAPKQATTSELTIDSGGMWVKVKWVKGAAPTLQHGWVDATQLATIKRATAAATWQTTRARLTCKAYSPDYIEYRAGEQLVLSRRICDGKLLDATSQRSLEQLTAALEPLGH